MLYFLFKAQKNKHTRHWFPSTKNERRLEIMKNLKNKLTSLMAVAVAAIIIYPIVSQADGQGGTSDGVSGASGTNRNSNIVVASASSLYGGGSDGVDAGTKIEKNEQVAQTDNILIINLPNYDEYKKRISDQDALKYYFNRYFKEVNYNGLNIVPYAYSIESRLEHKSYFECENEKTGEKTTRTRGEMPGDHRMLGHKVKFPHEDIICVLTKFIEIHPVYHSIANFVSKAEKDCFEKQKKAAFDFMDNSNNRIMLSETLDIENITLNIHGNRLGSEQDVKLKTGIEIPEGGKRLRIHASLDSNKVCKYLSAEKLEDIFTSWMNGGSANKLTRNTLEAPLGEAQTTTHVSDNNIKPLETALGVSEGTPKIPTKPVRVTLAR